MKIKTSTLKALIVASAMCGLMIPSVGCSHTEAGSAAAGSNATTTTGSSSPVAPEVKAQMDASRQADSARNAAMAARMNAPKK